MDQKLALEIRKIRSQLARGRIAPTAEAINQQLSQLDLSTLSEESASLAPFLLAAFSPIAGGIEIPDFVLALLSHIAEGQTAKLVCDPWAETGAVLASIHEATQAERAVAITQNGEQANLGNLLFPKAEWLTGDPLERLHKLDTELDIVASILPLGLKNRQSVSIRGRDSSLVELRGDFGDLLLAASATRLSPRGLGIFIVPPSFFFSERSVYKRFHDLGLSAEAAFALPAGSFALSVPISLYVVVVSKRSTNRLFVAQLSKDATTNRQIIQNFKEGRGDQGLELGCFVDADTFSGIESVHLAERYKEVSKSFGAQPVRLGDLAISSTLGRYVGSDFQFTAQDNAIYIPLLGASDVLTSVEDFTLKAQNYAQVVIDPERSDARFVARFLNTELGREIRERNKSGVSILKLNGKTLQNIQIFVPELDIQQNLLEIESRITSEHNVLHGLLNELGSLKKELWSNPKSALSVEERLSELSLRLSGGPKQQAVSSLDTWFEGLPFPLASILRAWQSTPTQDYKAKVEHLLHFFEAAAGFFSVVLLSAFSSNEALFNAHRERLSSTLQKQRLSFERATFGTWRITLEYFGKQTRQMLAGDKDQRALCADIFADRELALPEALSRKEMLSIFSATNKMRNDWSGHSGIVGDQEAKFRNEQLLQQVEKLREVIADTWAKTRLIHPSHCTIKKGIFENEVAVLMGSNSEFLKETRTMATYLDAEYLYLESAGSGRALKLLPLLQMGTSPQSAKNACYFFSRLDSDGVRFVSYHYSERPELKGQFDDTIQAIRSLTEV